MPKVKHESKEETPEVVVPEEEEVAEKKIKKIVYPEVQGTGKFQKVAVGLGYVVYNPVAQRVTEVIAMDKAENIVRTQNLAAQIKG